MAEAEEAEASETDIFQQQAKTIDLLYDVLQRQGSMVPAPTYLTPIQQTKAVPNYMLWIGIGAAAIWFLTKG